MDRIMAPDIAAARVLLRAMDLPST